jgi:hypothetical protein
MASYYGSNTYNGNYQNLVASPATVSQWTKNSIGDAAVAMVGTAGFVSGAGIAETFGLGAGGTSLVSQIGGFTSTAGSSLGIDWIEGKPRNISGAVANGVGAVLGGSIIGNPSGRYPSFGSNAFFSGVHAAYAGVNDIFDRTFGQLATGVSLVLTAPRSSGGGGSRGSFTFGGVSYSKLFSGITTGGSYAKL